MFTLVRPIRGPSSDVHKKRRSTCAYIMLVHKICAMRSANTSHEPRAHHNQLVYVLLRGHSTQVLAPPRLQTQRNGSPSISPSNPCHPGLFSLPIVTLDWFSIPTFYQLRPKLPTAACRASGSLRAIFAVPARLARWQRTSGDAGEFDTQKLRAWPASQHLRKHAPPQAAAMSALHTICPVLDYVPWRRG